MTTSLQLPTIKSKVTTKNPRRLILFGKPKIGKTIVIKGLENYCIIDLEEGTDDHEDIMRFKIKNTVNDPTEGLIPDPPFNNLVEESLYLLNKFDQVINTCIQEKPYKYLVVDPITRLEEWSEWEATMNYMKTLQGQSFNRYKEEDERKNKSCKTGTLKPKGEWESVLSLPDGAGYRYLRDSVRLRLNRIDLAAKHIIYLGHVREKFLKTPSEAVKLVNPLMLDLTAGVSRIVSSLSSAIGYVYREQNKLMVSFNTKDESCGTRCAHLEGKVFVLSEKTPTDFITHWDQIYIN